MEMFETGLKVWSWPQKAASSTQLNLHAIG